jgi:hypothetical protein
MESADRIMTEHQVNPKGGTFSKRAGHKCQSDKSQRKIKKLTQADRPEVRQHVVCDSGLVLFALTQRTNLG